MIKVPIRAIRDASEILLETWMALAMAFDNISTTMVIMKHIVCTIDFSRTIEGNENLNIGLC